MAPADISSYCFKMAVRGGVTRVFLNYSLDYRGTGIKLKSNLECSIVCLYIYRPLYTKSS